MKLLRKLTFRLLLLLPFLMVSVQSQAQSDPTGSSPATTTYAITNATIVPSPGTKIEGGTIIISDGLITEVGTNVNIPEYAEVIDGTDHYVYAGFIDGMSNTGAKRPEAMERPNNLFTPDPPNDYAGITPEISVVDQLNVEEASIANMRKIGFTISHTVPYGRMLPGKGSLILLRDGEHPDDIILKQKVSLLSQFVGAPGAYPGNTLGIMAKWRNLYKNAELSKSHTEMYAANPSGLTRPSQDRVLQAFYPVVDRSQPVFYNASTLLEAQRALKMQNEMGFSLVFGNLEQAWPLQDELDNNSVSLFLSLNIPEEPESSDDEELSDEVVQLQERREESFKRHMEQFDDLNNAGINFGFSTMGVSPSRVKKNIMAMQEFGFDSSEALATLTTDAAAILGISNIAGTLEPGKLGNAVVTTGPYFSDGSDVKMVFVDGHKYVYEIKEGGSSDIASEEEAQVLGTWNYSTSTPQGEQTGQMVFTKEDEVITGIWTSDSGNPDIDLNNISYRDGTLTFDFQFDAGGQLIEIVVTGDVIGTEYNAEASIAAFNVTFPVSAVKQDPN